jgi:hypothetical protein
MIQTKTLSRQALFIALILVFAFSLTGRAAAQTTLVTIDGVIVDEQGNPLPGATISLRNADSGYTYSRVSRSDGRYTLSGILPGTYDITAEMPGFAAEIRRGFAFKVGGRFVVDFKLPMKRIEEKIEVIAQAPLVEVTKSEVSSVVDRKQIEDVPLLGRNFADLAVLKPGVVPRGSSEEPVTTNAQPRGSGEFVIDGVSNEGNLVNYVRSNIPADAIQEFRVLQNQFSAEFGNTSGLVLNAITRSGANQYRGRVYGFWRDEAVDAVNYFASHEYYQGPKIADPQKTDYSDYRIGGFFGGPIIKDKFHFFVAYEHPYHKGYDVFNSPLFPKENVPWSRVNNQVLVKLNYQLNEKNTFSFRFTHDKPYEEGVWTGGIVHPEVACTDFYLDDTFQLNWTAFPSSTTLNEVRLQFSHADIKIDTKLPDAFTEERPSLIRGKWANQPQECLENRYQFIDNFSLFLDRHQIKFGIDFNYLDASGFIYNYNPGYVWFPTDAPFDPANPNTYPGLFIYTAGDPDFEYPTVNSGVFVQDSWRILPNFTLNLGLRYSYYYMKTLDIGNGQNLDPRLGFSWDPLGDGKTVIRGGAGRFTNNILTNEALLTDWFDQLQIQYVYNPGWPDPFQPNPFGTTFSLPGSVRYLAEPGQIPPSTMQYTLGIQRQFLTDFSASADFVYARGKHLLRWRNLNPVINYVRLDPTKGNIFQTEGSGKSDYKALLVSLQKRYSHGWAVEVSYTLSKGITDTQIEWSEASNYQFPELDYGPDNNDARHRLSVNGIVDLPLGFQLSAWAYYRTALPYNVITGNDDYQNYSWWAYPAGKKRNSGRGSDYFALNTRVSWFLRLKQFNIQVFAEMFNLTNRANFGSYVSNMLSSDFGKPTWADDPRLIQLGLRFDF